MLVSETATLKPLVAGGIAFAIVVMVDALPGQAATDRGQPRCSTEARIDPDPISLYGPEMTFEVRRNGERVGEHHVRFSRRGNELVVESHFDVTVRMIGIPVYAYTYRSTDVWREGCLSALRAEVDDDGKKTVIEAKRNGDSLIVRGPYGTATANPDIVPTNHWYVGVLGDHKVLNTLTGKIADVTIVDRGPATKPVNGVLEAVRHYVYTGDLSTEVWYDNEGRWVALAFAGADGSRIEFVCERCGRDLSVRR